MVSDLERKSQELERWCEKYGGIFSEKTTMYSEEIGGKCEFEESSVTLVKSKYGPRLDIDFIQDSYMLYDDSATDIEFDSGKIMMGREELASLDLTTRHPFIRSGLGTRRIMEKR